MKEDQLTHVPQTEFGAQTVVTASSAHSPPEAEDAESIQGDVEMTAGAGSEEAPARHTPNPSRLLREDATGPQGGSE